MSVDVGYIFEVWQHGKLSRAFALPRVMQLRRVHRPAHMLTWTLGDEPVREHSGVREREFTLSGRSGVRFRRHLVRANSGGFGGLIDQGIFASGPEIFRKFTEFLDEYEEIAKGAQEGPRQDLVTRGNLSRTAELRAVPGLVRTFSLGVPILPPLTSEDTEPKLVLHALDEKVDVECEVASNEWSRSAASSRFSYEWTITLQAYRKAKPRETSVIGSLIDQIRSIGTVIDQASNVVLAVGSLVRDVRAVLDSLKEPLRAVTRVARSVREVAGEVAGVFAWPRSLMETFFITTRESATAVLELFQSLSGATRAQTRDEFIDVMRAIASARRSATLALGNARIRAGNAGPNNAPRDVAPALLSATRRRRTKAHELQAGETLADLAERELGDRSAWPEIAELNGINSPNTLPSGEPLTAGAIIHVPSDEADGPQGVADDVLGTDLLMDAQGDLVVVGGTDFALVSGPNNFRQALRNRLTTEQGQNAVFPTFGLPRVVGDPNDANRFGLVAAHARTQLEGDPRVRAIDSLEVADEGDRYVFEGVLRSALGSRLNVTVPFPA